MIELNPTLRDLVLREAHLKRSRDLLRPVWEQAEAELRAAQAARPFLGPVFAKRKREGRELRVAMAREAVQLLRRGLETIERLEPLVEKLLESEVKSTNRIAEDQARRLGENGCTMPPLPKLPENNYGGGIRKISELHPAEAQAQLGRILDQAKKFHETGIDGLRAQAREVERLQASELRNRLLAVRECFRGPIAPMIYAATRRGS